jgi:hypothetical protein
MLSGLLELPQGNKKTIEDLNSAYANNLVESTHQLDLLGRQFLGKDYVPGNAKNAEVLNAARSRLAELAKDRGAITRQLAGLFMPSGLNW